MISNGLTLKQIKFVTGIAEGKTQVRAAIDAGYSKKCASEIAYENLRKPQIQKSLRELLEENGLTLKRMVQVLIEGTNARKIIAVRVIHTTEEGARRDAQTEKQALVIVPDYFERYEFLKRAVDLTGAFGKTR